jgi:inositol phosphorylceramide synthase catalytic subunit
MAPRTPDPHTARNAPAMAESAPSVAGRPAAPLVPSWPTLREWVLPSRTMARRAWPPLVGLAYIGMVAALGGLTRDHVLLGLLGFLDLYNEKARLFLKTFFPFILTGVLFDSMRYFYVPLVDGRVRTAEPYLLERAWFAVGGRTLNEIFQVRHWAALDLVCGFAYLLYVAEYIFLALVLFARGRSSHARTFGVCFLVVNVMGWLTYFAYPAAPPWYVVQYGFGPARMDVGMHAAAALRFDALIGTDVFGRIYGRGFTTFGALPSLHAAYPFIAAILAFRMPELRWARLPAVLFFLLICLSAVYLQHHYVIDLVLGVLYAAATVPIVAAWERRRASRAG